MPREAQSRELFSSLGLLCKRVARSDDQILTLVGHTVSGVGVGDDGARDDGLGALGEQTLGDGDILGVVLIEQYLVACGHSLEN